MLNRIELELNEIVGVQETLVNWLSTDNQPSVIVEEGVTVN